MSIHVDENGPRVYSGPAAVNFFRMAALLQGMKSELRTGMRMTRRASSCFTIVRREYGLRGNKQKLIEQFAKLVDEENMKMDYKEG